MSFAYGSYNPKAASNGSNSSSQGSPATSATGRKFAVMPKLGGLGKIGLGYNKPPLPKPAAASQVPAAPAAASPTPSTAAAVEDAAPAAPAAAAAPTEQQVQQPRPSTASRSSISPSSSEESLRPVQQALLQPIQQPTRPPTVIHRTLPQHLATRPAAGGPRVIMPVMRAAGAPGYPAQICKPVAMPRVGLGYAAGTSNVHVGNFSLNVPLREPTPEPEMLPVVETVVKEEYSIEEDYKVYGTINDVDIQVRNVVCNYTLPLHIDLRRLAQNTNNVTFDRGRGVLLKQKRNPMCYVKIYSSGKVYIVGCRSEGECMQAARRIARNVQRAMNKLGEEVRIRNYRVCNVLATCKMPFGVKIEEVAVAYPAESQYEPELSVGLVWRNKEPKATLRIHTTGSVTVTGAQSEADVFTVMERLYPILLKYKCPPRAKGELTEAARRKKEAAAAARKRSAYFTSGYGAPRSKMARGGIEMGGGGGVVGGRVVFDDEDEDDIYDPAFYDE